MFTGTIMNRQPPIRQTKRGIDGYECRLSISHEVEDFVIAEHHLCFSTEAMQHTQTSRALRRSSEIDADHDEVTTFNHWNSATDHRGLPLHSLSSSSPMYD